jgi:hypothetical protein
MSQGARLDRVTTSTLHEGADEIRESYVNFHDNTNFAAKAPST